MIANSIAAVPRSLLKRRLNDRAKACVLLRLATKNVEAVCRCRAQGNNINGAIDFPMILKLSETSKHHVLFKF
jgi:hypothetical protein